MHSLPRKFLVWGRKAQGTRSIATQFVYRSPTSQKDSDRDLGAMDSICDSYLPAMKIL